MQVESLSTTHILNYLIGQAYHVDWKGAFKNGIVFNTAYSTFNMNTESSNIAYAALPVL